MALEFSNFPRDPLPGVPTSTAPALPGDLSTMPFCQVLVLQHHKSWEVYLPSTHSQEALQETRSYIQVRTAATRAWKPHQATTASLVRITYGASDGQACTVYMSSHEDSRSVRRGALGDE